MKLTRRELYLLWIALALCTIWVSGCAMTPQQVADASRKCEALGLASYVLHDFPGTDAITRIQCIPKSAVSAPQRLPQTNGGQNTDENIRNEIREACIRQLIMKGGFADFTVCQ